MRITPRPRPASHPSIWQGLREGVGYVFASPPMRTIMITISLVSVIGISYVVLIPVFVREVLGGGPHEQGMLVAAPGVGAICSGLFLASRKDPRGLFPRIAAAPAMIGLGLVGLSFMDSLPAALGMLFATGFAAVLLMASCNTALQTLSAEGMRGRVLSLYATSFLGMAPLGSAAAGSLAHAVGVQTALRAGGIGCVLISVLVVAQLPRIMASIRNETPG
jgi:predicted MFS family arabinose efflux permease